MNDLEREQSQAELEKLPVEKEPVITTKPKVEPTVRIEETVEFKKALSKSTSSFEKNVSLAKQGETAAKADAEQHKSTISVLEAKIDDVEKRFEELVIKQADDPDAARKAYTDRRSIAEERRTVAKDKADVEKKVYDSEMDTWRKTMDVKARELVLESGIDINDFVGCQTEEEMEVKSLRFQISKGVKEPESKQPKFDPAVSQVTGMEYDPKNPSDTLKHGFRKLTKQ